MELTYSILTTLSTTIVLVMWGADELWLIGAIANVCDTIWYKSCSITVSSLNSKISAVIKLPNEKIAVTENKEQQTIATYTEVLTQLLEKTKTKPVQAYLIPNSAKDTITNARTITRIRLMQPGNTGWWSVTAKIHSVIRTLFQFYTQLKSFEHHFQLQMLTCTKYNNSKCI